MEEFEVRVYWREGSYDEENQARLVEVDTAQGPYQFTCPDNFIVKAKSTLDVWGALGQPVEVVAVNVTAAKAPTTK